jgi:pyridinium-3,5-biscarboxylic acid mononucleotide sulfurtransferase
MDDLQAKHDQLLAILRDLGSVAVAFSGGVDSAVVAQAAFLALGEKAVAVTAHSPSVAQREREDAAQVAQQIGIRHVTVDTNEFADPNYERNDGSRCYYCKDELYTRLTDLRPQLGVQWLVSGANVDDMGDYRPGLTAAAEHGVRHPLQEANITKAEVRALAKLWNLPIWDKPASPCLSSRIAPGVAATPERTARIEAAEAYLREQGLRDCRVRLHEGELARIEVPLDALPLLIAPERRAALSAHLLQLGFRFVTLDLDGLRSGSLNSLITLELKQRFAPSESTSRHATPSRP